MIGRSVRPTLVAFVLVLVAATSAYADSFPNTPEAPHSWSRRAILHRHSFDRFRFAAPYHAGMLAFLPGSAGYFHAYGTGTTQSPDLGPLGDGYFRDPFGVHVGGMRRLHERIGVGLDGSMRFFSDNMGEPVTNQANGKSDILFDPLTGVASLSLGVRLSRRFALSAMVGFTATSITLQDERDFSDRTEIGDDWFYDGIWSLGLVWALPERDVWAGVRFTRDVFFDRPNYVMPFDTGAADEGEYPGFFVETAQPWRTEGFFRLGLFDGRLMLAFSGAVERYDDDGYGVDVDSEHFEPVFVIRRSFSVEYGFTERFSAHLGVHPSDMLHEIDSNTGSDLRSNRLTGLGVSAGVSIRLASVLLDLGTSWRQEPVEFVAPRGELVEVADFSLGLIWEAAP